MQQSSSQSGFTLIELMVSLSLFVIVVLALVVSLFTVNDASRKVQAMRAVMDNLNFATESISRTVRTGTDFSCGGGTVAMSCPLSGDPNIARAESFSVRSTLGEHRFIEYRWVMVNGKGVIEKRSTGILSDGTLDSDTTPWIAVTAPEIDVESFHLYVDGADRGDSLQPSVIMKIEGIATAGLDNAAPFAVQSYLSQRTSE